MAGSQALTAWNSLVRIECSPPTFTSSRAMTQSLQDRYAPHNRCFGCGPANEKGLRIKSFESGAGEELVAEWRPEPHHQAFEGTLNGGICGALLDCHSNWAAACHLMKAAGAAAPPPT